MVLRAHFRFLCRFPYFASSLSQNAGFSSRQERKCLFRKRLFFSFFRLRSGQRLAPREGGEPAAVLLRMLSRIPHMAVAADQPVLRIRVGPL